MRWPFSGRQEAPPQPPLEPIRIFIDDEVIDGSVLTEGQRMTDVLQSTDDLMFLPQGGDRDRPGAWVKVETSRIRFLVPPPHVSAPERRQPREQQEVALDIGGYRVRGIAHLRPGVERDVFLRAAHPFLPLTEATVRRIESRDAFGYDVVIVNLRWAEFVEA
jgi:hypothetical protein